ncbi:cutinase family protein [Christensenellaceae bacterium OttesenSCG-928-L17]|nr:cutinase family protein [Christensenellaceae bacterium OttesenSCG-928-L17]
MRWKYIGVISAVIGAMVGSVLGVGDREVMADAGCADVEYVWLRGSGQEYGVGHERAAYAEQVAEKMEAERVAATYKFYEVDYPAINIDIEAGAEAFITAGAGAEYGDSIKAGITNLVKHIQQEMVICPHEKFILAGYSQGAQVVGEGLVELGDSLSRISYVALLGDPKTYLPEGQHVWPASPEACDGAKLSKYREWAPDCKTFQGALLARRPYVPIGWDGKVGLYCNDNDFICGSGETPLDISGHLEYAGTMPLVATKAVGKIKQYYPSKMSLEKLAEMEELAQKQLPMETVFLIDTSASMRDRLEKVRGKVLELAEFTLASGCRVALVEYRADGAVDYPKLLCDFTCGAGEFANLLGRMIPDGKPATWRGLWDGLDLSYESLDWRENTTKSAVVVTDSRGSGLVNYEEMIAKSYPLGGVSTFIASWWATSDLSELARRTGGEVVALGGDASNVGCTFELLAEILVGRPVARLEKKVYYPAIDETIRLNAETSYGIASEVDSYIWDILGDGKWQVQDYGAEFEWKWEEESEEYVVVFVRDSMGKTGMTTAKIWAGGADEGGESDGSEGVNEAPDEGKEVGPDEVEKATSVSDDKNKYEMNTDEWIEESWMDPGQNTVSSVWRDFIVGEVENGAEALLGEDLSNSLGKKHESNLEVVDAGTPQENQNDFWGWIAGGLTVLVAGAGLSGGSIMLQRRR